MANFTSSNSGSAKMAAMQEALASNPNVRVKMKIKVKLPMKGKKEKDVQSKADDR